jgi:hypothetical protein
MEIWSPKLENRKLNVEIRTGNSKLETAYTTRVPAHNLEYELKSMTSHENSQTTAVAPLGERVTAEGGRVRGSDHFRSREVRV